MNAPKVLLVEDDRDLVEMYETKFKMEGFEVIKLENGLNALDLVKKEKPAVVLLDIVMPELDGFQVLKSLKVDPETKATPVILLTNLSQETDIKKGTELGAADYLVKANFTPNEVVAKARKAMDQK